jgi:membrane protease YdiL (CAAX protease family)
MKPTSTDENDSEEVGLRDVPWKWSDGLTGIAFLLPWRFLLLVPREWLQPLAQLPQWALWVTIYLIPVAWRMLFPVALAYGRAARFRVSVPGWRCWRKEALAALGVLAGCWGLLLAILIPWMLISGDGRAVPSVWSGAGTSPHGLNVLLLLSAMTIAPITEEVFFRGLVFNCLRRYCPLAIALISQAAIFALLHPFDVFHLAIALVFGMVLGAVYEWRKTLLAPILLHAMQNVLATIAVAILGQA